VANGSFSAGASRCSAPAAASCEDGEPEKLEAVKASLIERFAHSDGILVLNDEAHHVWDEPGHAAFEERHGKRQPPPTTRRRRWPGSGPFGS